MNEIYTAIISVCSSTAVFVIQSAIRDKLQRKKFMQEVEQTQIKQTDCIKEGVKALLHDKIIQKCEHYISEGKITTEELQELEYLNEPYKALGGNGTVKAAMHKVHELL